MNDRREQIRDYIEKKGEVTTEELCALFPERSAMTIRRDLAFLEESRHIIRTHGGARIFPGSVGGLEDFYNKRETVNTSLKEQIAQKALAFVEERRCLFLDAGTTAMIFAKNLPDSNLTILTSAPNIGLELSLKHPDYSVILTGGNLNHKTFSCSGYAATQAIADINIDTAFLCSSGFSLAGGFSVGDFQEGQLKREVIKKARNVIMLMDSSKVGKNMPYTFARPEDIDLLISDDRLTDEIRSLLTAGGVKVI